MKTKQSRLFGLYSGGSHDISKDHNDNIHENIHFETLKKQ